MAEVKRFGFRVGRALVLSGTLMAALVAAGGGWGAGIGVASAQAAAPSDDGAAVQDLTALLQKARVEAGLAPLTVQPLLASVAAGRAVALSGAAPVGDVQATLVQHHYIPMQVVVLDARAGGHPTQAMAVWRHDPATRGAVLTPGISEVGVARMANPASTGPNDAYLWEVILAQPLVAAPEH